MAIILLMAFFLSITSAKLNAQTEIVKTNYGAEISVQVDKINLQTIHFLPFSAGFSEIQIDKMPLTSEERLPMLPFQSVLIGDTEDEIEVKSLRSNAEEYQGITPLYPKQAYRNELNPVLFDVNDHKTKRTNAFNKEYIGKFRGINLTRLTMFPTSFEKGTLSVYKQARFSVATQAPIYQNPEEIMLEANLNNLLVVFTPERFKADLESFILKKQQEGFGVSLYTLEEIGSSDPKVIQAFIKNLYVKTKFTYAIIVGEEKVFPTFYVKTSSSSKTPSDLPYFAMDGDNDYLPEVFYGRFVVNTKEDLLNQLAKNEEYSLEKWIDNYGQRIHAGIASNEGYNPSDVDYVKMMLEPYDLEYRFFFQADPHNSPRTINETLIKGTKYINYIGHGSGYAWASVRGGGYTTEHIKALKPETVKPIIIDVACMNGKFTKGYFGERWMNETRDGAPIGAVAYYGGSVNISWHPPAIMAVGISRLTNEKKLKRLGETLMAGQFFLIKNHTNLAQVKENLQWYHLFGDPTLEIK